jgi:hypothetical protein
MSKLKYTVILDYPKPLESRLYSDYEKSECTEHLHCDDRMEYGFHVADTPLLYYWYALILILKPHDQLQKRTHHSPTIDFNLSTGCAMAQAISCLPPTMEAGLVHVGFVVDKVGLGHVFLRVFRFSCVYHSTVPLRTHVSSGGMIKDKDKFSPHQHEHEQHLTMHKISYLTFTVHVPWLTSDSVYCDSQQHAAKPLTQELKYSWHSSSMRV